MAKRTICIIMIVILILSLLIGCNPKQQNNINSTTTDENSTNESVLNSSYNVSSDENTESNNNIVSSNNNSTVSNNSQSIVENNQKEDNSSNIQKPVNSNTGSSQVNNSSNNVSSNINNNNSSTNNSTTQQLVLKTNSTLYGDYPTVTHEYIFPKQSSIKFQKNSSNIYENKYVKVDVTTAKDGYLLITYKDPWADNLWIVLDETAVHSGVYVQTHHFRYDKGSFKLNEPIAVPLPKTDAIYYLVVDSEIKGKNSDKLVVNLGQLTVKGAVSYQDMVPTEEQIKLVESPSGVYSNKYVKINTNTANKGYVEVEYIELNGFDINVAICCDLINQYGGKCRWHYDTGNKGKCKIKVPLTYGNREYTISVTSAMKNESTGLGRASKKAELTVNLTNVSNTGAFLLSTGEVIFDADKMFIKKATELSQGCKNDFEKVAKIYDWLTNYLRYKDTEYTALGIYKCDLDKLYLRGTGVCYDYAVILAAMLRSQGIPSRVVFGKYANYMPEEGHVWNEVYIQSSGSIKTDKMHITGNKWCRLDPTMSRENVSQTAIDYMNNSSNYIWQFYY